MEDLFVIIALLYGPVIFLAAVALVWARHSRSQHAPLWLRRSAVFWLIALAVTLGFALLTGATCQGNALYGYAGCTLVSEQVATFSVILLIFTYLAAILYTVLLFLGTAVAEYKARSKH
tara:strand:- start:453 stop:809 length:357 start_codon:yes stop_codon:yes gene_type:complete